MPTPSRRLPAAAAFAMLVLAAAAPVAAQETNTVGPPQLKDFRLPGQRTTPPPVVPSQPVLQPAPQPQGQPARQPAARPVRQSPPPAAAPRPETRPPALERAAAARPAPERAAPAVPPPPAAAVPALPLPAPAAPAPAAVRPAPRGSPSWLWLALPVLALLAFFGLRRRRSAQAAAGRRRQRAARAEAPAPAPAAALDIGPRARLELDFAPERAVATDAETRVHYDIVLRNVGEASAGNIRIDARMFNAGATGEIGAFLRGPIHAQSGSPDAIIAPGGELRLASAIAMPKEEVRGIEVQGRSIFVPVVAINVAYDWAGAGEDKAGAGRTSKSWLVGREAETPTAKMGAFRLDLGPRIYRSVGQRQTELAHSV